MNIEELYEHVRDFYQSFQDLGSETNRDFNLVISAADSQEMRDLVEGVNKLSEVLTPEPIIFSVEHEHYQYKIKYRPHSGEIDTQRIEDSDYEPSKIFQSEELSDIVTSIRENQLEEVQKLGVLCQNDGFQVDLEYHLQKESILKPIKNEYSLEEVFCKFYFSTNFFLDYCNQINLGDIKREGLFSKNYPKSLVILLNDLKFARTKHLALINLNILEDKLPAFIEGSSDFHETVKDVAKNTLIESLDEIFVPPESFDIVDYSNSAFYRRLKEIFGPYKLLFAIMSFADSVSSSDYGWKLQIQGKRHIDGFIRLSEENNNIEVKFNDEKNQIEITDKLINNAYSIYEWIYLEKGTENKINVFRNIATLYARNLKELLQDLEEINQSIRSNYRYYVQQSVEGFLDFRQRVIDKTIQTHHRFSDLRHRLMEDLSRDLFRTFGYFVVVFAAIFLSLPEKSSLEIAYSVGLFPILLYTIIAQLRLDGIEDQFNKVREQESTSRKFYKRFFNEEDFKQLVFDGELEVTNKFSRDILIYKIILVVIFLGIILLYLDIWFWDLLPFFPFNPTSISQ